MTVVAVKILRNHIEIACDSCVSYWYRNKMEWSTKSVIKDFSKIFTTNWVTVGCSWLLEHSIWLKEHLKTNLPKSATLDDMESFFLKFYKERKEKNSSFEASESTFIMIFSWKVFRVSWYLIYEVTEYDAIGSWMFEARTALYLWFGAKKACETASELSQGVWWNIEVTRIDI